MALTTKIVPVVDALLLKLTNNAGTFTTPIPTNGLYYGDQTKIPVTPTVCIEPSDKAQQLRGVPRKLEVDISVYIIVYHSRVTDVETNLRDSNILAEEIEGLIHEDRTLNNGVPDDDLLIHSFISQVESGYATKETSLMRASRLLFVGKTQNFLPFP